MSGEAVKQSSYYSDSVKYQPNRWCTGVIAPQEGEWLDKSSQVSCKEVMHRSLCAVFPSGALLSASNEPLLLLCDGGSWIRVSMDYSRLLLFPCCNFHVFLNCKKALNTKPLFYFSLLKKDSLDMQQKHQHWKMSVITKHRLVLAVSVNLSNQ